MINWLKKHFIPHEENDHRPHFLRKENTRNVLLVVLFVEIFVFLGPFLSQINRSGGMAAVLPSILSDLTNEERQSQKLNTLTVSPILNEAAQMKANDMATKGYFAHTSPEGITPWYWLIKAGYKYQYAGENLAINFNDSKDVTNAWMNSPTHKANIVKENYTEIGTGIATGMYEGRETVFVAQVYANPIKIVKDETTTTPTKSEIKKVETKSVAKIAENPLNVLGAEIENNNVKVTTTSTPDTQPEVTTTSEQVTESPAKSPTFWQKVIASPRNSTNTVFFVILGIVVLSLILNIVIKIKHHHPDLITNGLITLVIIGLILIANYYIAHRNMIITQSIDYSAENK